MGWLHLVVLGAAGTASMRAAMQRGDLDEAARQGALAGPAVVERALASTDPTVQLAAIAAAPIVEDRAELLDALARLAGGSDRRTALPAADAARAIARELAGRPRPDHLADDDLASWRATWARLAMRGDRWVELRVAALDVAAALDPGGLGVDLGAALGDPDAAFRRAAATIVPLPAPAATYAALTRAVIHDVDPEVALGAAQSLCISIDRAANARPILDALGPEGLSRIRALVQRPPPAQRSAARDAGRCLAADRSDKGTPPVLRGRKRR